MSRQVVVVEAARTPIGKFRGDFSAVRADHLGAHVLQALVARTGLDPAMIDDVIFGCVTQVGEQCANVARTSLLSAGWPEAIPGLTIDRKCGSGEAALHLACAQIAAGLCDVVVAGGVENMTRVRMGGNREIYGEPFGWKFAARHEIINQGEAAERIADLWQFEREQLDAYAAESHRRAGLAADQGYFDREIAALNLGDWQEREAPDAPREIAQDQTIRRNTSLEKLAELKPSFRENGRVTAGNSSQISDGAAALLLMEAGLATRLGLPIRAVVRDVVTVGSDPTLMLTGPVAATKKLLSRAKLTTDDIELFEVNEAFAPVPLMWMQELGVDASRLNVNGGAIALGHPLGASGARIAVSLIHEMERRGTKRALQSICCAGGLGTATLFERPE